jgi:probable phosphoglycerate mutase
MVHSTSSSSTASNCGTLRAARADQVLWLVRHGESTWNTAGLAQGHCDLAELTPRGHLQARVIACQLRGRPVRAVYASDLRRAVQTAAPLAAAFGLTVVRDARLRERCLGSLEGSPSAAILPAVSGLRVGRVADPDARPAGGESVRELYQRVAAFAGDLAELCLPGDTAQPEDPAQPEDTVVVAHGGTLRVLTAYVHGVPVERMSWDPLANGHILRIARWPDKESHESTRRNN